MSKTFKEYEKENTLICPRCNLKIKILNPIPMSIFDDIHEDMYISHEAEYLERKALQQRIDKAIEILKLCNSKCAKETIDILREEKTIPPFEDRLNYAELLINEKNKLDILRGEDNGNI